MSLATPYVAASPVRGGPVSPVERIDYLDATRAFVLILGIVFHASLSFMPSFMGWAVMDVSTSPFVAAFVLVSHSFRMEAFFLLAGLFSAMVLPRKGAAAFFRSRLWRLGLPFVVGWFVLRPLLVSGWIMGSASLRGDVDVLAGLREGFRSLNTLPQGLFTGSHLWFLYYLLLVTALVLTVRAVGKKVALPLARMQAVATKVVTSWLALPALAAPTAGVLWFMDIWGMDTPDRSLVPHVPVLLIYSGFFSLGWVLHHSAPALDRFARVTWARLVLAAAGIAAALMLAPIGFDPADPAYTAARIGFVAAYGVMMWTLVALTLGTFRVLIRGASPLVRYIADSSYWLYLMHLPVVVWLQVALAEWPIHWTLKLGMIVSTTLVIGWLSYDLLVRSTWVGAILNGRRRSRWLGGRADQPGAVPAAPAVL